ncbi:glycosyltransferase [Roseiterribacter gracilis]|uniref:Beta-monoglucosyldiacylglycerol synthase n=1 Tax=Roseiterribacter gracilis TaxID=2812848 RepID=A0A8S8XE54_9PROT|nr:glycosyl transferase [Rhodospirillales bacterium TMPK1]
MAKLKIRAQAATVILCILLANVAGWFLINQPVQGQAWLGEIASLSFAGYQPDQSPLSKPPKYPSYDQLDHDLQKISKVASAVRTYSSINGLEKVPEIARKYGMTVTAGAWVAEKDTREAELVSLIQMAKRNRNVTQLVVGNEHILTGALTVPEQIAMIKRVKRETGKPTSTAEIWPNWLKYPELAEACDYIAIHTLPYWEQVPFPDALEFVKNAYAQVHAKYPNKRIVLSEVGWPSEGPWVGGAEPSVVNQGKFIRDFLNFAQENGLEYNIVEAIDQPWKRQIEGPAGAAWGVFDVNREPKFPMTGSIVETRHWPELCAIAALLALPGMIWFVTRRRDLKVTGLFFFAGLIQASASIFVWTVTQVTRGVYDPSIAVAWSFLIGTQILLAIVVLNDGLEFTEILWRGTWHRRVTPVRQQRVTGGPKVSIHVPCYNEPPAMVIETLDALAKLEYDAFEVLLIDNNTKDPAVWKPVEAHVNLLRETHGEKFRFFHLENWPGYKAGALNFGMKETAADVEIIAVIDSDYLVDPDWLSAMVPNFANPKVALVQSPQDYRDWDGDTFKRMMHWEYAGFFAIGMVARNERNAIIQHGTMTMIRRTALEEVGGWAEWCITEDAELGLTLFERGYEAVYAPDSFGRGVVPDSLAAYKTQRFRWAYGAVQIVKKHWKNFLPGGNKVLTSGQKYHFVAGWLPWFADAAHLLFAAAAIFWTIGMVATPFVADIVKDNWDPTFRPPHFGFPPIAFMIPTIGAFVFKVLSGFFLYQARIKCSFWDKIGAAFAGMGLTHTVGRAVWVGLFTKGRPFVRTPKIEDRPALMQGILMARDEIKWMLALWVLAGLVLYLMTWHNREALLWSIMLLVQSLPFFAAFVTAMINAMPGLFSRKHGNDTMAAGAQPAE